MTRRIGFHVTDRCQLDCAHCLRDPEQIPKDLSPALIGAILDQATALLGVPEVAFTGGEPTLHPAFLDVVDAAVDRGCAWHFVTNGRKLAQVLAQLGRKPERLARLTHVTLSLDGSEEQTHDALRAPGSYREVMSAAAHAAATRTPFVLQMAVHARNVDELERFGLLASHLGARGVSFVWTQATGTPHDEELRLAPFAWQAAADRIDRLAAALRIAVHAPEGWPRRARFHVCGPFRSEELHVTVDGELNLCCAHAGIPRSEGGPSDSGGALAEVPFAEAHGRLLDIVHEAQGALLRRTAAAPDAWQAFHCNACLAHFGKPHWEGTGAAGPRARRERWIGAWGKPKGQAPNRRRLPVVR